MLISFMVNGYKAFNNAAKISFKGNKHISNKDYVFDNGILKSAIIYGPNNTGKSSFIDSITVLKKTILDGNLSLDLTKIDFDYNFFKEKKEISYEIEFEENKKVYHYFLSFSYDDGITEEKLLVDDVEIFDLNKKNNNSALDNIIDTFKLYKNKLIISALPSNYKMYTDAFFSFFYKMEIIDKNVNFSDIVELISTLSKKEMKLFNELILAADISIEKVEYVEDFSKNKVFNLLSHYKMNNNHSIMFSSISDSSGTQIFMAYIAKIIKLKKTGGILIIDEIDRSLHTLLSKSLITLFNATENKNIQLLTTSHDLELLDCLNLFRKDQIWFTYKDNKQVYFYSLNDFKPALDKQVRNKTMFSYLKGMFGALPHPNIEEVFYED